MKVNRLLLLSIFMLAILTLGAVSASDDGLTDLTAADDETSVDDVSITASDALAESGEDVLGDGPEVTVETEKYNRDYEDTVIVSYYFPENYTGSLQILLDDEVYYESSVITEENVDICGYDLWQNPTPGIYELKVDYLYDEIDASLIDKVTKTATLNVTEDIKEPDCEVNPYEVIYKEDSYAEIANIWFENDVSGNLTIYIDDEKKYEKEFDSGFSKYLWADDLGIDKLDYGVHTYKVIYSGDDDYLGFTREYNFTITYSFSVHTEGYDDLYYGSSPVFEVSLVSDAKGNVEYTVNGKKYSISAEDLRNDFNEMYISLNRSDLKYGYNEIIFQYVGDDYPLKTVNLSQSLLSVPKYGDWKIEFDKSTYVCLTLPSDAKGSLKLYEGDEWDEDPAVLLKSVAMKDGFANITIEGLDLGSHSLFVEYDGDDYEISYGDMGDKYYHLRVTPKYNIPKLIWHEDKSPAVKFNFPSKYNGVLTVTVGDESKTFTVKDGEATVELFNLESATYDEGNPDSRLKAINIQVNYDDDDLGYSLYEEFKSKITDIPSNTPFNVSAESTAFKDWSYNVGLQFPEGSEGIIDAYVDGKKVSTNTIYGTWENIDISLDDVEMGNHTLELRYYGDDYFAPSNRTVTFEVTPYHIEMRDVRLGEYADFSYDNSAYVRLMENATGSITIKVDGKVYETVKLDEYSRAEFDMSNLTYGTHTVEISYKGNYPGFTKKQTVVAEYRLVVEGPYFTYGETAYVKISAPKGATGKVTVKINGTTYDVDLDENGTAKIDVSDFTKGRYLAAGTYAGDSNYPAMEDNTTFEVEYKILNNVDYKEYYLKLDNATYSLRLPGDADGDLEVYEYGDWDDVLEEYVKDVVGSAKLVDGRAELSLADLSIPEDKLLGKHYFHVRYTGTDYEVDEISSDVDILQYRYTGPDYEPVFGDDVEFAFELPGYCTGNVQVYNSYDNAFVENISVVNGKAVFSITKKAIGREAFKFIYDDGKVSFEEYDSCVIWPENVTVNKNAGADDALMTVKMPSDAKGNFSVTLWRHQTNGGSYHGDVFNVTYSGTTIVIPASKLQNGTYTMSNFIIEDEKYGTFNFHSTSHFFAVGFYEDNIKITGSDAEPAAQEAANLKISVSDITEGETATVGIEIDSRATGNVNVIVAGKEYSAAVSNGKASLTLDDLTAGDYAVTASYDGNAYLLKDEKTASFKVAKKDTPTEEDKNTTSSEGNSTDVPSGDDSGNGTNVPSADDDKNKTLNNAKYTNETAIANETQEIPPAPPVDSGENETVTVDPKITASNLKMFYNDGSYFKVRVYGTDGKVAKGVSVVFKVNGKKFKTVKTDKNGYAKVKVTQLPKTYKFSATALGKTVTKKVTVKKVLSLKKVSVKKSFKKLTLTATLKKVKGKYLKGKKITFKFNGKKVKTVKTDKKGVAKVTIPSSVLGKLKVNKKVTYLATYGKCSVKYTVKVGK